MAEKGPLLICNCDRDFYTDIIGPIEMGALEKILAPARLVKALLRHLRSALGKDDRAALVRVLVPSSVVRREVKAVLAGVEIARKKTREPKPPSGLKGKNRLTAEREARLEIARKKTRELYLKASPVMKKKNQLTAEHEATTLTTLAKDPFNNREAIADLFRKAIPPTDPPPRSRRRTPKSRRSPRGAR